MGRMIPWEQVAEMARRADGAWRLHPSLAVASDHTLAHMRRRVPELWPDAHGRFDFLRGQGGKDSLGREVFSIYVRYIKEEE